MISSVISRLVILLFGNLYPAYASYKAVKTKNVKEYVKWMTYWIVFALFTCCETFTDVFLGFWFPFYYEIKIIIVIWLLSPATKGSNFLYRKFVHPMLTKKEPEIDEYLMKAKEQSYHTMLHLGTRGMTYATNVIMQTAIKGGGGIVNHLRRSYSLCDLTSNTDIGADMIRNKPSIEPEDEEDGAQPLPIIPRDQRTTRSMKKAAAAGNHLDMYFPEVDLDIRSHQSRESVPIGQIRSTDDISSGYSSADPVYAAEVTGEGLTRTSSVGGARARARGTARTGSIKRGLTTEDSDVLEDFDLPEGVDLEPPTSTSWVSTFPIIPSDPSALSKMFISTNPCERVCLSSDPQILRRQLEVINVFREANVNWNFILRQNNLINNLLPTVNLSEVKEPDSCAETVRSADVKLEDDAALNLKSDPVKSSDIKDTSEQPSKGQSNNMDIDVFHDSLTNVQEVSPHDITPKFVDNSEHRSNSCGTPNTLSDLPNKTETEMTELSNTDITIDSSTPKESKSQVRKSHKKKQAPLPPGVKSTTNVESQEIGNNEEDFVDAESDMPFGVGGELRSSLNSLDISNDVKNCESVNDIRSSLNSLNISNDAKNCESLNDVEKVTSNNDEQKNENSSDEKSPKVKQKSHMKIKKYLPKGTNVQVYFGFLQGSGSKSKKEVPSTSSSEPSIKNDSNESLNKQSAFKKPNEDGDAETIFIPLTGDDEKVEATDDNQRGVANIVNNLEIREMSQSPTAKRKHIE